MGLGPTPTELHYRRQSGTGEAVREDRHICVHGVMRQLVSTIALNCRGICLFSPVKCENPGYTIIA